MSGLLGRMMGAPAGSQYEGLQQQYRIYLEQARKAGEQPMAWQDFVKSKGGGAADMLNPGGTPPQGVRIPTDAVGTRG